jgi:hypothetical protein
MYWFLITIRRRHVDSIFTQRSFSTWSKIPTTLLMELWGIEHDQFSVLLLEVSPFTMKLYLRSPDPPITWAISKKDHWKSMSCYQNIIKLMIPTKNMIAGHANSIWFSIVKHVPITPLMAPNMKHRASILVASGEHPLDLIFHKIEIFMSL